MADMSWQTQSQSSAGSAVLDMDIEEMEVMDDGQSDISDYDNSLQDDRSQTGRTGSGKNKKALVDDIKQRMGENVTQLVWQAGAQSAKRAWTLYGNIDVLRPYFDVEPKEVQKRLLYSLIPIRPTDQRQQVPRELYGPIMVVLTLIALLLYQMKTAEHKVEEGTLMGSAFGVCFMYWLGASSVIWFLSYVCNVRITILQILSMMGYAMFGHCIVLFLGTVIHTSHHHMFFYFLWAIIGGLSTLRMAGIIMSRTRGRTERLLVISAIAVLHLLFLLYLHFAYHTIVEELSDAFHENLLPVSAGQQEASVTQHLAGQPIDYAKALDQTVARQLADRNPPGSVAGDNEALVPPILKDQAPDLNAAHNHSQVIPDSGAGQFSSVGAVPESILLAKLKNSAS